MFVPGQTSSLHSFSPGVDLEAQASRPNEVPDPHLESNEEKKKNLASLVWFHFQHEHLFILLST